jgi:hypothetical protein
MDVDDAVAQGLVAKVKIEGKWVFHLPNTSLEKASSSLFTAISELVSGWLIAPMAWLPRMVPTGTGGLTASAADVLLHQLVRRQAFDVLGLLTKRDQPHLALHMPADRAAVAQEIEAMESILMLHDRVRARELPDPPRTTDNQGWRATVLQHGEFLGLGAYDKWELVGWSGR